MDAPIIAIHPRSTLKWYGRFLLFSLIATSSLVVRLIMFEAAPTDKVVSYWRWWGMFPYRKSMDSYKGSPAFLLINVPVVCICTCGTFYYQFNANTNVIPPHIFLNVILSNLFRLLTIVYISFLILFSSPKIKNLMENLDHVNRSLIRNGFQIQKTFSKWRYCEHFAFSCFVLICELVKRPEKYLSSFAAYIPRITLMLYTQQMLQFLSFFCFYYGFLEHRVSKRITARQRLCLVYCYDKLCEVVDSFQDLYGAAILFLLGHIFLYVVSYVAGIIIVIRSVAAFFSLAIFVVLNIASYSIAIFQLIAHCGNTKNSAQEFNRRLYELILEDKSHNQAAEKKFCLHLEMQREVVFTAFDFFEIDYPLLHSVIAAGTTYLVILFQFNSL